MKRILIKVKQKHLREGKMLCCKNCPVALAIEDVMGYAVPVTSANFIFRDVEFNRRYIQIPRSVSRFIAKFDNNKPTKPFNFFVYIDN